MTNGPVGRSPSFDPNPKDLPPFPPDGIDPDAREFLEQTGWEAVPGAADFAVVCSAWRRLITTGGAPPELMAEIHTAFAEQETAQPQTPAWDALRAYLATHLFGGRQIEDSLDVMAGMRSFWVMAQTADYLGGQTDYQTAFAITAGIRQRLTVYPERLQGFGQAFYSLIIRKDPYTEGLDELEAVVVGADPEHDAVKVWADFQRQLRPGIEIANLDEYIKDDARWADIPVRVRQHIVAVYFDIADGLRSPDPIQVQRVIQNFEGNQEEYPDAIIWDDLRLALGVGLARSGHPAFAAQFGQAIRSSLHQQSLVTVLLRQGYEQEAVAVTIAMTDLTMLAETFVRARWPNDRGIDRIFNIVNDEGAPTALRLACAVALRDEGVRLGEDVTDYNQAIALLETQQDIENLGTTD